MTTSTHATQNRPNVADLASRLRLSVTRLARRLRKEAGAGLSPSLLSALSTIERHGPLTLGDLANAERVAPPTMTRVVGHLADAGLVERVSDPEDRRVAWVGITSEGKSLVTRSRRQKDVYLAAHLRAAAPDELEVLERAAQILERLLQDPS